MDQYFRISNADGKAWVLPAHNMRTALCLYQPGGVKGKLLKALLPLLWRFPLVRSLLSLEPCGRPCPELEASIRDAFGLEGDFEIAAFEGTPCAHQKTTLQVFRGKKILGYVKLSDKPAVYRLFQHEQRILDALHASGIDEVPRILALKECPEGRWMLAQTTTKTLHSGTPHQWGPQMAQFIERLENATGVMAAFEQTEMAGDLGPDSPGSSEAEISALLPERYREVFVRSFQRFRGRELACCLTHNDFTPWNMYVQDGRLEVFDWEYASFCNPVGMDRCHFLVQSAFFEKRWTAEQVYERIIAPDGRHRDEYTLYLLSIIARYLRRDPSCADSEEITRWGQLLEMLESHRRDTEK